MSRSLTIALAALMTVLAACASPKEKLAEPERSYVGTYRDDPKRSLEETVALGKREGRIPQDMSLDDPKLAMAKAMASLGDGKGSMTATLRADGTGSFVMNNPFGESPHLDGRWFVKDTFIEIRGNDPEENPLDLGILNDHELVFTMGDQLFVLTRRSP